MVNIRNEIKEAFEVRANEIGFCLDQRWGQYENPYTNNDTALAYNLFKDGWTAANNIRDEELNGCVVVPVEPTPKMIDSTWNDQDEIETMSHNSRNEFIYKKMIQVAMVEAARAEMSNQKIKTCEYCDDGNGECVFPYYGLGPHTHKDGILGSTEFTGEIPENFSPDGDGLGVYTHCLNCGGDGTYDGVVLEPKADTEES